MKSVLSRRIRRHSSREPAVKRQRKPGVWQGIFGSGNKLVGWVELRADGRWHATLGQRDLGSFATKEGAAAFVRRLAGADRARHG
jgi:hypothetical protein